MNRRAARPWSLPVPLVLALWLPACGASTSMGTGTPSTTDRPSPAPAADAPANAEAPAEPAGDPDRRSAEPNALPHQGPGLAVGQRALPFSLKDQAGQVHRLDQWLGQGPVALVFFRSADW